MLETFIVAIRSWMINDKLMLNDDKTEFLVHSSMCIISNTYENTSQVNVLRNLFVHL